MPDENLTPDEMRARGLTEDEIATVERIKTEGVRFRAPDERVPTVLRLLTDETMSTLHPSESAAQSDGLDTPPGEPLDLTTGTTTVPDDHVPTREIVDLDAEGNPWPGPSSYATAGPVDLVAFVRARLDERAAKARAATPGPWLRGLGTLVEQTEAGGGHLVAEMHACEDHEDRRVADAEHIADNDPEFVLADVAAKREIVDEHQPANPDAEPREGEPGWPEKPWFYCKTCGSGEANEYPTTWPCRTLRLLATVHAGHPQFREEWRP